MRVCIVSGLKGEYHGPHLEYQGGRPPPFSRAFFDAKKIWFGRPIKIVECKEDFIQLFETVGKISKQGKET